MSLVNRMIGVSSLILLAAGSSAFAQTLPPTITGKDGTKMVLIAAGPFIMGSGQGNPDETPPHDRILPAFYMDSTEVTCAQYAKYVQATGAAPPVDWKGPDVSGDRADKPVTFVTWYEAMSYAAWAGKRLPTEAEWEKAARGADGRRFPWGNTPAEKIANLDGGKFAPVGAYPKGVSPYGCFDMAGNAWEWTADWYEPYPGTNARSIFFGHKYKVIRGGGAEGFYGLNDNTGRCTIRGRVLPYAGELYLGFRCAEDVDPSKAPYDPTRLLTEAQEQLKGSLPKPRPLSYEAQYDRYVKAGQFPVEVTGRLNQSGLVRGGVPFPQGLVKDIRQIRVLGPDGKPRPVQPKMLTPWKDGSARWVLLDFPAAAGEKCAVAFNPTPAAPTADSIHIQAEQDQLTINTGRAVFLFTKDALLKEVRSNGQVVLNSTNVDLVLDSGRLKLLPAEQMKVEEQGPLHATIHMTGWFADSTGRRSPIQYDLRAHLLAGSTRANLLLTLTHLQPRTGKIEDRTPMARIVDASLRFGLPDASSQAVLATDTGVLAGPIGARCDLFQPDTVHYTIARDGKQVATGTRSPGWMAVQTSAGWLTLGVRHFWQNCAKALAITPKEAVLRLWAGKEPVEFEATIAKTHEIVLELSREVPTATKHVELDPMRLTLAPAWACGTQALGGPMLPRCNESIAHMPYWELARENGMRHWMRAMCYSWRDFGDTRHGGEAKGANAFHNLEYDVPFNFLLQYLTTGQAWYLDAAEIQCRHQADIDTDHVTGQPYKHMIFHTTWYADIAHMFLRGLVVHYWLTGEERSLEVARQIADHIAPLAEKNREFGNERQIGWGLYALTGMYEATLDERYLNAASKLCDTLVSGMSPYGKFRIRWDNRMSLMNGMAMNGMMSVEELTGDQKLADGILRLARRTLAFYPDYALRTLHGYAWALTRTNDPRYLDVLDKSWEACLDLFVRNADATDSEVHAWRFPWFAAKYRFSPLFEKQPDRLPDAATWKGQWLPGESAELFIRTCDTGAGGTGVSPVGFKGERSSGESPFSPPSKAGIPSREHGSSSREPTPILLVLHGMVEGKAELFDPTGKLLQSVTLKTLDRLYQPAVFNLPPGDGTYRLRMSATGGIGWEVHHDAKSIVTLYDPKADQLDNIYPRAYGYIQPGAKQVRIVFEAVGEGFHTITMYDPAGNAIGAAQKYLDLEDKSRFEVELKVPVPTGPAQATGQAAAGAPLVGYSLEAFHVNVLRIDGFLPYWAGDPKELFNPETRQLGEGRMSKSQ